jgi:multisubunit Na+/H+ antiporter MnhB subunit
MNRFPGGVLCAASSVMLMLCALHLWARESAGAGLSVAAVALGLLLAAVTSLKAGTHKT